MSTNNYSVRTFTPSPVLGADLYESPKVPTQGRAVYLRSDQNVTRRKDALPLHGLWFPVPPEQYEFVPSGKWNTVSVVGFGDVIHPAGRGLAGMQMSGFFPSVYDPHVCLSLPDKTFMIGRADEYVRILTNIYVSQDVVLLTLDRMIVNLPVAITSFQWSEAPGRPDHRLYDITFTEWRKQELVVRTGVRYETLPKTYRPRKGEDLFDVSYRWFGTPARARELARINGIKFTAKGAIPPAKKVLKLKTG